MKFILAHIIVVALIISSSLLVTAHLGQNAMNGKFSTNDKKNTFTVSAPKEITGNREPMRPKTMGDTEEQWVMEMPGTMKEEEQEERNKQPQQEVRRVYHDMNTPECGDKDGGWKQVAYIDVTNMNNTCPEGLNYTVVNKTCKPTQGNSDCIPLPIPMCIRSHSEENGCSSVIFPTDGKAYTKVCGRARGYQFGVIRAFHSSRYAGQDLNSAYVSGLSVTHGTPGNRKHIWTFAAGYSNAYGYIAVNCPCAQYPGPKSAEFVGDNYFVTQGMLTT